LLRQPSLEFYTSFCSLVNSRLSIPCLVDTLLFTLANHLAGAAFALFAAVFSRAIDYSTSFSGLASAAEKIRRNLPLPFAPLRHSAEASAVSHR
jgi:hypothetical protein